LIGRYISILLLLLLLLFIYILFIFIEDTTYRKRYGQERAERLFTDIEDVEL